MGGISIWQLVIVAVIVILLFGTKKLRGLGGDVGSAVKGFKKAMADEEKPSEAVNEKSNTVNQLNNQSDNLQDGQQNAQQDKQTIKDKDQA